MSIFIPVIPQQHGQKATAGISIAKKPSSYLQAEFEKFKLNLHASFYDYFSTNGVSYDVSRNHINIRELKRVLKSHDSVGNSKKFRTSSLI